MAKTYNWRQGADLTIRLNYKEGATAEDAVIVDLSSGYAVRMDLVIAGTKDVVYTFNSEEMLVPEDVDAVLTNGAGGLGNIQIVISRSLTLPGGDIYEQMQAGNSAFEFDLFLRNTGTNKQDEIHEGLILITESKTLWA